MTRNKKRILVTFIAMAIIPLLVHFASAKNDLIGFDWVGSNDTEFDFFLVFKSVAIQVVAAVMLIILITDLILGKYSENIITRIKKEKIIFILLSSYFLLTLLSGLFAFSKRSAFLGGLAQHETVLVIAGYVIMCFFSYVYLNSENTLLFLYKLFLCGATVITVIGLLQFIKHDLFMSYFGKVLLTSFSELSADMLALKFEPGIVYMTLYNPNYAGTYVALVLPFVAAGMFIPGKKIINIVSGIISAGLIVCLVGAQSETGIIAVVASACLCVVMLIKNKIIRNVLLGLGIILGIVGAVVLVNRSGKDNFELQDMSVSESGVLLKYNGEDINVSLSPDDGITVIVSDINGNVVNVPEGLGIAPNTFEDGKNGFVVTCRNYMLYFVFDNGRYFYRNVYGYNIGLINKAEKIGFKEHERFGNGRGYMWSRTIPLLKKYPIIGCGPDNFIYTYPNDDYLGLANNEYNGQIITRPHNMFLQMGTQTGVLSLILFLAVYVIYFIKSYMIYAGKREKTVLYLLGLSVFIGVTAYMVAGLANDSIVCVAPVFWVLLGIGFAVNHLQKGE